MVGVGKPGEDRDRRSWAGSRERLAGDRRSVVGGWNFGGTPPAEDFHIVQKRVVLAGELLEYLVIGVLNSQVDPRLFRFISLNGLHRYWRQAVAVAPPVSVESPRIDLISRHEHQAAPGGDPFLQSPEVFDRLVAKRVTIEQEDNLVLFKVYAVQF